MAKKNYVVILPNGSEYFGEADPSERIFGSVQSLCDEAIRSSDIRTPRKNPQPVALQVFRLDAEKGKLNRVPCGRYEAMPYLQQITPEEFSNEMEEILSQVPEAFRSFLRKHGDSSNMEDTLRKTDEMAGGLMGAISRYNNEVKSKKK